MVRNLAFITCAERGELLPKGYEALQMEARKKPEQTGFAALMNKFLRTDPNKCLLCGNRMRFSSAQAGRHAPHFVDISGISTRHHYATRNNIHGQDIFKR